MTHSSSPVQSHSPSTRSLWRSVLGGPITWSIYFIGGYALSEAACRTNSLRGTLLGINALSAALLLMTTVALLVILRISWIAYQNWQHLQSEAFNQSEDYSNFMASVGVMLSGLAAFLTLVMGLTVIFLPVCS